jgi:hypothetical protein
VTLIIQYFVYHTTVNRTVQLTLVPITIGVGYATVYDLDVNFVGTGLSFSLPRISPDNLLVVFACCGVVATALAQIFTNTYQKSLDCNALQLLYHTAPIIAAVCSLSLSSSLLSDLGNDRYVPFL